MDNKNESKVTIEVNGEELSVKPGHTVLAALTSNKIRPKSKSNGGSHMGLCGAGYCYECAVTINGAPNTRTCVTPVRDGMKIKTN